MSIWQTQTLPQNYHRYEKKSINDMGMLSFSSFIGASVAEMKHQQNLANIKKIAIPILCLLHMTAIFWWTLPHNFAGMVAEDSNQTTIETKLFKWLTFSESSWATGLLTYYIDITGSQQYWGFFAPQSPKFHQYLSVCNNLYTDNKSGEISCKGPILFSNLKDNFETFSIFSNSSRYYRLTETLINLNDPELLQAFTQYYQTHQSNDFSNNYSAQLLVHQFELYPDLKDIPKAGYRIDKILWENN